MRGLEAAPAPNTRLKRASASWAANRARSRLFIVKSAELCA